MSKRIGIVDVGGGLRDIFGAGVFDLCEDEGITFDYCVGVSAGSANLASFLSGQRGRNYKFYTEYVFRKEYISLRNWLRDRNYVNTDYSYGTLSNSGGECPLDFQALCDNPAEYIIVATNALNGEATYFDKSDLKQDFYNVIKASGTVPVINRAYYIDGIPYYDGGIADPIPFEQCLHAGCSKVIVILTRPKQQHRSTDKDLWACHFLKRQFPQAADSLAGRAERYNAQLDRASELEKEGKVLILAPDDIGQMKMLKKDLEAMETLYQKGYDAGKQILEFLREQADSGPEQKKSINP